MNSRVTIWSYPVEGGAVELYFVDDSDNVEGIGFFAEGAVYEGGAGPGWTSDQGQTELLLSSRPSATWYASTGRLTIWSPQRSSPRRQPYYCGSSIL